MNHEEAQAWLRGERSHTNIICGMAPASILSSIEMVTRYVQIEVADAASVQRAYWVAKAHRDAPDALTRPEDKP